MRIAYVTIHIEPKIINGGVGKKINSQISIWKNMGHTVRLFSLTPEPISSIPDIEQFLFKSSSNAFILKFITREIARSTALTRLISQVWRYEPDVIYFRFGLFTFPLQDLFKIAPVVLEVNSNDQAEYRSRGPFFYWLNRITRNFIFSHSTGWIASSHELANLEINRRYRKPVCVVSNGIELSKYQPLPPPKNQFPALALVGSPGMNWHGVDKLVPLAEQFPDIKISIIGYRREDFQGEVPENIHLYGYLEPEEVKKVLAGVDAVFGTLALHRKNMQEASPLKVREALAYAIPVILAYRDTDLTGIDSDLFLYLPNVEENVLEHTQTIHDFAFKAMGRRVERSLIEERINQYQKEEARLKFFETMLNPLGSDS
ncbi:MAG TPA: glycosyltransferase [Anaerolineales bacterium]|nr:glycosyltransferase [Anaerolineales bacterium]HLO28812.1 glycosyltransferase [Anaerolineales bacterium]